MSKRVLAKAGKSGGTTLASRKPKLTPNQKAMKDAGTGVPKVGEVSKEINKVKKKIDTLYNKRIKKQSDDNYKSYDPQSKVEKNLIAQKKRLEKKKAELNKKKKEISDKDKAKKDLATKNKKTGAKGESQTQKNLRFKKKYDIQEGMGLDAETGGSRSAAQDVDQGKAGKVTATPGKNFVQSQINKARVSEAKQKVSLQGKVDRGTATASEKAKLNKLKKADKDATGKSGRGQRTKVKLEKGDYVNTKTGEIITDPKSLSELPGGRDLYVKDPTPPRMAAIKRNAEARSMTAAERIDKGLKETKLVYNPKTGKKKYKSPTDLSKTPKNETGNKGGTGRNRQNLNMGGLTKPTANQTGLKKLPTTVRNKMGYMYGGGMAKKKKMGNMDYRKGGLVIMIGTGKPMKKGKK